MSYEMAATELNRDGVKYVDLGDDVLTHMARSLEKILKNKELDSKERAEKQFKLDAIYVILAEAQQASLTGVGSTVSGRV